MSVDLFAPWLLFCGEELLNFFNKSVCFNHIPSTDRELDLVQQTDWIGVWCSRARFLRFLHLAEITSFQANSARELEKILFQFPTFRLCGFVRLIGDGLISD